MIFIRLNRRWLSTKEMEVGSFLRQHFLSAVQKGSTIDVLGYFDRWHHWQHSTERICASSWTPSDKTIVHFHIMHKNLNKMSKCCRFLHTKRVWRLDFKLVILSDRVFLVSRWRIHLSWSEWQQIIELHRLMLWHFVSKVFPKKYDFLTHIQWLHSPCFFRNPLGYNTITLTTLQHHNEWWSVNGNRVYSTVINPEMKRSTASDSRFDWILSV